MRVPGVTVPQLRPALLRARSRKRLARLLDDQARVRADDGFVPCVTVTGRSVDSRSVRHGTPSTVVSSWMPPESVSTTGARRHQPDEVEIAERLGLDEARLVGEPASRARAVEPLRASAGEPGRRPGRRG